jgi:hypothetical protein
MAMFDNVDDAIKFVLNSRQDDRFNMVVYDRQERKDVYNLDERIAELKSKDVSADADDVAWRTEALDRQILQAVIERAARRGLIVHDDLAEVIDTANKAIAALSAERARTLALSAELARSSAEANYLRETCDNLANMLDTERGEDVARPWARDGD